METINLAIEHHKQSPCIALHFKYNPTINNCVRKVPGIRWSNTLKAWYMPCRRDAVQQLEKETRGIALLQTNILHEQLSQIKLQQQNNYLQTAQQHVANNIHGIKKEYAILPQITGENREALQQLIDLLKLKAYSPNTIRTYKNEFGIFLQAIKSRTAQSISPGELKRYLLYCLDKLKLTENTVNSRLNALKFYYEQVLGREKFFFEIPRPQKPLKLPKVISEEKILEALFEIKNLKHKAILLLAYSAGLRVSEVINIKPTDIDSQRMQIRILQAKGKKDRMVTLSTHLLPLLREYYLKYKPTTWLFEGQYGAQYTARSAQQLFRQTFKKLHLPAQFSFHSLRHSYATHLLDNGTDISYIQKLLGHNDIKTTLRYANVSIKDVGKIESPLDRALRKRGI